MNEYTYNRIINTLNGIKVCFGPQAVSASLSRRPRLRDSVRRYQRELLDSFENDLAKH